MVSFLWGQAAAPPSQEDSDQRKKDEVPVTPQQSLGVPSAEELQPVQGNAFDCQIASRLQRKRYLQHLNVEDTLHHITLLNFRGEPLFDYLSDSCIDFPVKKGIVVGGYKCADTRILHADSDLPNAKQELRRLLEGRPVVDGEQRLPLHQRQPNGVVVGPDTPAWITEMCTAYQVPVFSTTELPGMARRASRVIKNHLVSLLLQRRSPLTQKTAYKVGFENGYMSATGSKDSKVLAAEDEGYAIAVRDLPKNPDRKLEGSSLPAHLCCPITKAPIKEPFITKYGTTCEGWALREHLQHRRTDPVTRQPLQPTEVYPNRAVSTFMEMLSEVGFRL